MLCNSQCVVLRKSCYRENTQFSALVLKFSIFRFLNQVSFSDHLTTTNLCHLLLILINHLSNWFPAVKQTPCVDWRRISLSDKASKVYLLAPSWCGPTGYTAKNEWFIRDSILLVYSIWHQHYINLLALLYVSSIYMCIKNASVGQCRTRLPFSYTKTCK